MRLPKETLVRSLNPVVLNRTFFFTEPVRSFWRTSTAEMVLVPGAPLALAFKPEEGRFAIWSAQVYGRVSGTRLPMEPLSIRWCANCAIPRG